MLLRQALLLLSRQREGCAGGGPTVGHLEVLLRGVVVADEPQAVGAPGDPGERAHAGRRVGDADLDTQAVRTTNGRGRCGTEEQPHEGQAPSHRSPSHGWLDEATLARED